MKHRVPRTTKYNNQVYIDTSGGRVQITIETALGNLQGYANLSLSEAEFIMDRIAECLESYDHCKCLPKPPLDDGWNGVF